MPCSATKPLRFAEMQKLCASLNPSLAEALSEVMANEEPKEPYFYSADYSYGQLIVREGKFQAPCGQHTTCDECRGMINQCRYSDIPLAIVRTKAIEVFAGDATSTKQGATVPLKILRAGNMFGVFETLDYLLGKNQPPPPWSVSAGGRSIWVLAPLKDKNLPEVVGEVAGVDLEWDRTASHCSLVQSTMGSKLSWKISIVILGQAFVRLLKEKHESNALFRQLLLELGWEQSSALRHSALKNAQLRTWFLEGPAKTIAMPLGELYHFATICHLLSLAEGDYPAFQPAGKDSEGLGPFKSFEGILYDALSSLKGKQAPKYYPVVLQAAHLSDDAPTGYYSLRCPSLLGHTPPNVDNFSDTLSPILRTLHSLCEKLQPRFPIDIQRTAFFAQAGKFDIAGDKSEALRKELLAHAPRNAPHGLYTDSPFLVAGVRLARADFSSRSSRLQSA